MAVVLVTDPQKYLGLSTDTKPSDPRVGAEFIEKNTGVRWIYDGTDWFEDLTLIYALIEALKEVRV